MPTVDDVTEDQAGNHSAQNAINESTGSGDGGDTTPGQGGGALDLIVNCANNALWLASMFTLFLSTLIFGYHPAERGSTTPWQALKRIVNHVTANKIETALCLASMLTMFSVINFFLKLSIFGCSPESSYLMALLSNAATSALRLYQRLPNFQFSRAEANSALYFFYSLIFLYDYPLIFYKQPRFEPHVCLDDYGEPAICVDDNYATPIMVLVPMFLFALLHACSYTEQILNQIGPNSLQLIRYIIGKLKPSQRFVLVMLLFVVMVHCGLRNLYRKVARYVDGFRSLYDMFSY